MGAFSGAISAAAYRVIGTPDDWDKAIDELTRGRFQTLEPGSEHERSIGWVQIDDPFGTEFTKAGIFYGNTLAVAVREDQIKVPPAQLKLHLQKAVNERLAETGKERLSRKEQQELMEELKFTMSRRMLPTIKIAELVWNTDSNRLWFFCRAGELLKFFEESFMETFGVRIIPESPFTIAQDLLGEDGAERMFEWQQSLLVDPYED